MEYMSSHVGACNSGREVSQLIELSGPACRRCQAFFFLTLNFSFLSFFFTPVQRTCCQQPERVQGKNWTATSQPSKTPLNHANDN